MGRYADLKVRNLMKTAAGEPNYQPGPTPAMRSAMTMGTGLAGSPQSTIGPGGNYGSIPSNLRPPAPVSVAAPGGGPQSRTPAGFTPPAAQRSAAPAMGGQSRSATPGLNFTPGPGQNQSMPGDAPAAPRPGPGYNNRAVSGFSTPQGESMGTPTIAGPQSRMPPGGGGSSLMDQATRARQMAAQAGLRTGSNPFANDNEARRFLQNNPNLARQVGAQGFGGGAARGGNSGGGFSGDGSVPRRQIDFNPATLTAGGAGAGGAPAAGGGGRQRQYLASRVTPGGDYETASGPELARVNAARSRTQTGGRGTDLGFAPMNMSQAKLDQVNNAGLLGLLGSGGAQQMAADSRAAVGRAGAAMGGMASPAAPPRAPAAPAGTQGMLAGTGAAPAPGTGGQAGLAARSDAAMARGGYQTINGQRVSPQAAQAAEQRLFGSDPFFAGRR